MSRSFHIARLIAVSALAVALLANVAEVFARGRQEGAVPWGHLLAPWPYVLGVAFILFVIPQRGRGQGGRADDRDRAA